MSTVRKMHLLIEIDLSKCGQVEVQDIKLKYWILTDHLKFSCFIDNKKISSIWIKTGMRDNRLTRYSHFFQWTSLLRFWRVCWKLFSYHAFTFISLSVFVLEDHYSPSFLELIKSYVNLSSFMKFNYVFVRAPPFLREIIRQCHAIFITTEQ